MALKNAQPETQLEVDLMILDFLAYEAAQAVIDGSRSGSKTKNDPDKNAEMKLNLYHSFLTIFKCNHPYDEDVPTEVRFRTRLVKFAALYLGRHGRYSHELSQQQLLDLRSDHRRRAEDWWGATDMRVRIHPTWTSELPVRVKRCTAASDRAESDLRPDRTATDPRGTPSTLLLLDLLPMFMEISAALRQVQGGGDISVNESWMRLAAEFMIQAVLEQWTLYRAAGPKAVGEAFAWGFLSGGDSGEWFNEALVNDLFCETGEQQEVEGWAEIKRAAIKTLEPPPNAPLLPHLEQLSKELPVKKFDDKVFELIDALQRSQNIPLLLQLELGEVPDLSPAEAEALRSKVQWPVQKPRI